MANQNVKRQFLSNLHVQIVERTLKSFEACRPFATIAS
jgi:2-C-methyl-D-erythritol 4-phosphate cytidylyltransferase